MVKLKQMKDMAAKIEDDEQMAAELEAEEAPGKCRGGKRKRGRKIEDDDDFIGEEESESVPTKMVKGKSLKRKIEPVLFKRGVSTNLHPTKVLNFFEQTIKFACLFYDEIYKMNSLCRFPTCTTLAKIFMA